jgi:GNAT superfamily N-acetyltransferase
MKLQIAKLTDAQTQDFNEICQWHCDWWGQKRKWNRQQVEDFMRRCLGNDRLPLTFVGRINGKCICTYQLLMDDLIQNRPDFYPWLAAAYVKKQERGKGYMRQLMATVPEAMRAHGIKQLYLHTRHKELYEKFGWQLLEQSRDYKGDGIQRSIYVLRLDGTNAS